MFFKIRPGTVAFHKYRMMERLKVKTNVELFKLCDEVPNDIFGNRAALNLDGRPVTLCLMHGGSPTNFELRNIPFQNLIWVNEV